ncbi:MAG: hypothetical protein R3E01_13705 [Pirellulaceae bacterium]|nr:hypothetical protein [Planctomycetales bacterium]
MSQFVALEWDSVEARVVVARRRGTQLTVEHAFDVDLSPRDDSEVLDSTGIGQRIAAALSARRVNRAEALVAIGRASIELRRMTLPPVPDEELPEIVRFQAMRQFSNFSEEWPLDFYPVDDGGASGGEREVLAAAISPDAIAQAKEICKSANLKLKRCILRPCAVKGLLPSGDDHLRLVVDLLAEEADLTIVVRDTVPFLRTVRLGRGERSGLGELPVSALLAEVRRTMVAAQNQVGGRAVDEVYLCGSSDEHMAARDRLHESLQIPVHLFEPFQQVELDARMTEPRHSGRYAPLLGMLADEVHDRQHAIDFLHPRKRPEPPNKRRVAIIAGSLVGIAALAFVAHLWWQSHQHKQMMATLNASLQQMNDNRKRPQDKIARYEAVRKWNETNVDWLSQLEHLSQNLSTGDKLIVNQMTMTSRTQIGGEINFDGNAINSSTIKQIETELSGKGHVVTGLEKNETGQNEKLPWSFREKVAIARTEEELK